MKKLDKILFTRHLHTLIQSGIALDEALKILTNQVTDLELKRVSQDLHSKIKDGRPLHEALDYHREHFSDFFINFIKIGEASGTLEKSLAHLFKQQEQDYELISETKRAMIYPSVVIGAAIAISVLMMVFVMPIIVELLKGYDAGLPLPTKILIFISDSLVNYGLFIGIFFVVMAVGFFQYIKTQKGRYVWDSFKLKVPVLRKIVKEFNLARLCRSMSALLQSGVAIDQALKLTSSIFSNVHYKDSIESSVELVSQGAPLTDFLKNRPDLYPAITSQMLEVGEKTGKFDIMFERLAEFYEKSVLNTVNGLSKIIEPAMLLVIGAGVAFIALAVLLPIWQFAYII